MHQNVTVAEEVVLSCFRTPSLRSGGRRNRVVYEEANFPSVRYLYQAQPDLEVVAVEDDRAIVEAIDERTLLVPISHVLFKNAEIQDVEPIIRRAHEAGAYVVLDCYQSAGIVPFDLTALGVDFAVGGCLKWLCGGPGNAFLYTRPDLLARAKPALTGWLSHEHPFDFDTGEVPMRGDAMHMMNGTPSIPAYYAALAGLDIINAVGVDRIRDESKRMTARLLELVDEYGFTSAASRDPDRLAGTVAVNVPDASLVSRTLKARDFIVDYRPPVGVRISPHFYNTMEEIERVMAEMASITATKDYAAGDGSSLVT